MPFPRAPRLFPRLSAPAALALALLAGGCEHRRPDELSRAVSMGEQPPAMEGSGLFFGGAVKATVTISRGIGRGIHGGGKGGGGGGGGGGGSRRWGGDQPDVANMEEDDAIAYLRARQALGSPVPPVTLHLKLENLSAGLITVEIADFSSDLGNFAVQPPQLALEPHQVAEPDSMTSQLGVTSDEIPVKVTLKSGGKTESRVLAVRSLAAKGPPLQQ